MKTMIKKSAMILLLLLIVFSANAAEKENLVSTNLPEEAFSLLVEAAAQDCILCAKQMQQEAFHILTDRFKPGDIIKSNHFCLFVRTSQCGPNELMLTCYPAAERGGNPLLSFRFHTAENKLVGIAEKDFTEKRFAEIYQPALVGALFTGELEVVPYRYGDGPTYNYHAKENVLQVHCKIRLLKPLESGN
jgi:hypothetical protein